jgi:hypothetical protein
MPVTADDDMIDQAHIDERKRLLERASTPHRHAKGGAGRLDAGDGFWQWSDAQPGPEPDARCKALQTVSSLRNDARRHDRNPNRVGAIKLEAAPRYHLQRFASLCTGLQRQMDPTSRSVEGDQNRQSSLRCHCRPSTTKAVRLAGGQKDDRRSDVLGLSQPPGRHAGRQRSLLVGAACEAAQQFGLHRS